MGNAEAEELGKFRRNIERAELIDLGPVIANTLDELIDVVRSLGAGRHVGVEMAAALSAELHRRAAFMRTTPTMVGTA